MVYPTVAVLVKPSLTVLELQDTPSHQIFHAPTLMDHALGVTPRRNMIVAALLLKPSCLRLPPPILMLKIVVLWMVVRLRYVADHWW